MNTITTRKRTNKTGFKGVRKELTKRGKPYCATIRVVMLNPRKVVLLYVGHYKTALEASKARTKYINKLK